MMEHPEVDNIISLIEQGNIRGLSKAISIVENDWAGKLHLLNYSFRKRARQAISIGITGVAGAGKSTLIDKLIEKYRSQGKNVGVITVDPSSPVTGGAFLGDRIRMSNHNTDPGVYIRSLASRKSLGGLSETAKQVLYLYQAFGFDVIIVETVGVGQDEVEISKYVDLTALILVPGLGDYIQMAKAGILEIADVFIINKSDKPEAEVLKQQLYNALSVIPEESRPLVVSTIASTGVGLDETLTAIEESNHKLQKNKDQRFKHRISEEIRSTVLLSMEKVIDSYVELMTDKVVRGDYTPFEAAEKIVSCIKAKLIHVWEAP